MAKLNTLNKFLLFCSDRENYFDNCFTLNIAQYFNLLDNDNAIKENSRVDFTSNATTANIAENINDKLKVDKTSVLFINVDGLYGEKTYRQEQLGIEILKWLRCKYNIPNPVILYGFLSNAELLKKKPENLIINSEGCYYYQLPIDFSKLKDKNIIGLLNQENLKIYLKPAVNIETLRHQWANIWGLKKLCEVHKEITGQEITIDKKHETDLNFIVAEKYYSKTDSGKEFEKVINNIISLKNSIDELNKKRILYIDDERDLGWSELLNKIIGIKHNFTPFDFDNIKTTSEIKKLVVDEIEKNKPDLVLLDYRLKGESENQKVHSEVSGSIVLTGIINYYPDVPVIMLTASNNSETTKYLFEHGAFKILLKEGFDNHKNSLFTYQLYFELLVNIYRAFTRFPDDTTRAIHISKYFTTRIELSKKQLLSSINLDYLDNLIITKNKKESQPFNGNYVWDFDICLIDTCILLPNIYNYKNILQEDLQKLFPSLVLLCYFCEKYNKKVYIVNETLHELLRISKDIYNHLIPTTTSYMPKTIDKIQVADYSISFVEKLIKDKLLQIHNINTATYDIQAYADPSMVDFILDKLIKYKKDSNNKIVPKIIEKVLFVTNDGILRHKTNQILSYNIKNNNERDVIFSVIKSEDLINNFKTILDIIRKY